MRKVLCGFFAAIGLLGCATSGREADGGETAAAAPPRRAAWAIALHGGAGVVPKDTPAAQIQAYEDALAAARDLGAMFLHAGGSAVDVVEIVVRRLEDDPLFNAGRGAVFTAEGRHELDASIMDGRTRACGAVAGVTTVKNPIGLARRVMEGTRHVLLAGAGAEAFATEAGVERVPNEWFDVATRRAAFDAWDAERRRGGARGAAASSTPADRRPDAALGFGTVGCVALDRTGRLAAATSTGGMTGKRPGRIGDSPVVGAGTYADDATCAVSCTGTGEEFIRHAVAHDVHARTAYGGRTAAEAAREILTRVLKPDDGGLIVVDREGRITMEFNSDGMFRAAADANGLRTVAIW